ncbi:predicted protein [Sclerotinia sclerotiorum 1980 UF-70]|uniref:Uncharacterized protein n=2 Tax=Sclerotinia sclerotiorum (strain ATCC 18683 / 1980 / Ss-1) TaxID=665079 RepID=A0A1D9PV23_SCLS1|nr:predicted protein [Sclerotinia sclerotiorum 1980 UF-70]APA06565.1 hypothetical protein sscle_02g013350 [Sclerotinia sclerotiorum 1980 UF-70]EDN97871.1 predicted protein [Sclerotinia sclerotiorum 1980 UF-70]
MTSIPSDYNLSVLLPTHSYGDYPTQCMSTLIAGDILKYQTPIGGIYQPTSLTVSSTLLVHGEHKNGWNIDDAVFTSMMGSSQTPSKTATTTSSITTTSSTASSTNSVYTTTINRESGAAITTKTLQSATLSSSPSDAQSSSSSTSLTSPKPNSNSTALAAGVGIATAVIILGLAAAVFLLNTTPKKAYTQRDTRNRLERNLCLSIIILSWTRCERVVE